MNTYPTEYVVSRADGKPIGEEERFIVLRVNGSGVEGNIGRIAATHAAYFLSETDEPKYLTRSAELVEFVTEAATEEHIRQGHPELALGASLIGKLTAGKVRNLAKSNVPNRPQPDSPDRKA